MRTMLQIKHGMKPAVPSPVHLRNNNDLENDLEEPNVSTGKAPIFEDFARTA